MPEYDFMHFFPVLGLVVLLVIGGCTAGPFGNSANQGQSVELVLNNSANTTQTFEVWMVELPATMTAHYRDGTAVKSEIGQGLSNHDTGPRTVMRINFSEPARLDGRYTLDPSEENRSVFANFSRDAALVVVVFRGENRIFSWVSANCDDQALVGLEVKSRPNSSGGVFASYGCQ
jgi:hypothetical protein